MAMEDLYLSKSQPVGDVPSVQSKRRNRKEDLKKNMNTTGAAIQITPGQFGYAGTAPKREPTRTS
jgi:hypothetical protein